MPAQYIVGKRRFDTRACANARQFRICTLV
jgi:hypothetical protein